MDRFEKKVAAWYIMCQCHHTWKGSALSITAGEVTGATTLRGRRHLPSRGRREKRAIVALFLCPLSLGRWVGLFLEGAPSPFIRFRFVWPKGPFFSLSRLGERVARHRRHYKRPRSKGKGFVRVGWRQKRGGSSATFSRFFMAAGVSAAAAAAAAAVPKEKRGESERYALFIGFPFSASSSTCNG